MATIAFEKTRRD